MIRAYVSGESLEGLADEFLDELLPQMVTAVNKGTEILVEEWKSVASRTEGSGREYGGAREVTLNVHSAERGSRVFSRKGRMVRQTRRFSVSGGKVHRAAAPGEPLTKVTGEYVRSIAQGTAAKRGHSVRGYAVARVPYAARQEFGGRDKKGRYIPPHPTARVAEKNAESRIYDAIDRTLGVA